MKKNITLSTFFILAAVLLSSLVHAAPLTLPAAVGEAMSANPDLKKLELSADSASWRKLEALSGHLPQISLNATHFLSAKYSRLKVNLGAAPIDFPSAFPQDDMSVEASLTLFDGFRTLNLYRAALLEAEAASLEYERARFKLHEAVQLHFYKALAALELSHVADQNIKTLEQHLSLVQMGERAGTGTRVDVLRIESQLEEARAEKLLNDDNVDVARRELSEILGEESDPRQLEGTLPIPRAELISADLRPDVSSRDDVQAQIRREQAQDRLNTAAASFWLPKVSVFGTEDFYKFGSFDPAILTNTSYQSAYSVGLRLTWNLFDGGASIAKKSASR